MIASNDKGYRQRLAEMAATLGATGVLSRIHDAGRRPLVILAYHRVSPVAAERSLNDDLISATPQQFELQMKYLREQMHPVSIEQVIAHVEGKQRLPRRAVLVTFDDGFADTYEYAFPCMRRYRIPAAVFVTTGCVETKDPFWFELAACIMTRAEVQSIRLDGIAKALPIGSSIEERRESFEQLQTLLKSFSHEQRTRAIQVLRDQVLGRSDPAIATLGRPLNWAQILEMARGGIDFGSHTVTHPNLASLAPETVRWELATSKLELERKLDCQVRALAYPFGTPDAYNQMVVDQARNLGFRAGVTYRFGANWQSDIEAFDLRRRGVSLATSLAHFRAITALPNWA